MKKKISLLEIFMKEGENKTSLIEVLIILTYLRKIIMKNHKNYLQFTKEHLHIQWTLEKIKKEWILLTQIKKKLKRFKKLTW
jgi:recombinational DNA repair ATPase RecF